ncbi:DUF4365 domain-containing protein [Streptomyces sp. DH12]|uniref:DUF4365 domain-containing protein n=1 Tax=Streptomyces sp. DH12 TaxID=2857010 RepID=UPI001E584774|nr:DUF4365 domain-containing protein [Streptomyces sp. DH12]
MSVGGHVGEPGTWQQEQISLAYLSAVATRAGATSAQWNVDKDGVDATLKRDHIQVEFQMKCSFSPTLLADGETYAFDLDIRTYDLLRHPNRSAAGFLGLVVVPKDLDDWLVHDEESLMMHCTGYYARIQNLPAVSTESTTRIHLPKKQRLDSAGLDSIFAYAFGRLFGNPSERGV